MRRGVDLVAAILATGLVVAIVLLLIGAIVNIIQRQNPTPTLGENTSQVLIAVLGGIVGILGSYVGFALRERGKGDDE